MQQHTHTHTQSYIKLVQADKDKQPAMPNYPLNAQYIHYTYAWERQRVNVNEQQAAHLNKVKL